MFSRNSTKDSFVYFEGTIIIKCYMGIMVQCAKNPHPSTASIQDACPLGINNYACRIETDIVS